jgi:hypothetical protein
MRLAAAATACFLRRCRLAYVLVWTMIELTFALGAAKVVGLSCVFGVSNGGGDFYVHAANGVFHNCCAAHTGLLGS